MPPRLTKILVYGAVIVLALIVFLLIVISPPALSQTKSVYQGF